MNFSSLMQARMKVMIAGPPGCGKTARIKTIAAENGLRVVIMRCSLNERVDFGGALVPNFEKGVTEALPLDILHDLQNTTVPTLLFLDDIGQAPPDVQSAIMRLFDEGYLSPHVLIWGATNRPKDAAGVARMNEALRSRFDLVFEIAAPDTKDTIDGGVILGTWKDEVDGWCDWALDVGAPPEVIAYHRSNTGEFLYAWQPNANPAARMPDYRTWEAVIKLWNAGITDRHSISATIGKVAASHFLAFADLAHELPSPDQVWMDPHNAPVPDAPASKFLVASMLANAVEKQHADAMVKYMRRLGRVYGAFLARDAYKRLGVNLSGSKEWVKWFNENQDIFTGGGK